MENNKSIIYLNIEKKYIISMIYRQDSTMYRGWYYEICVFDEKPENNISLPFAMSFQRSAGTTLKEANIFFRRIVNIFLYLNERNKRGGKRNVKL